MARKKPTTQKVQRRDVNAALRAAQALDLFIQGYSYEEIARQAGYPGGRGSAYNAIQRELSRVIVPKAEEARKVELLRMKKLLISLMPRATGTNDDNANWASARVVSISEHLAKLQGAYPTFDDTSDRGIIREYIGLDPLLVIGSSNGHSPAAISAPGRSN